jgi:septal ring factor EnvC (AmiA/AmiB activator)
MILWLPKTLTIISIYSLLFTTTNNAFATPGNNNINNQLSTTRKNMANIQTNLTVNKHKVKKVMTELQQTEEEISKTANELYTLSKSLQQDKKSYQQLKTKFANTSSKYKIHQAILAKQIQFAYQIKHTPQIKLFFGENDPNNINRILAYYEYIAMQQQQTLQNSTSILEQTKILEQQIVVKITAIQNKQTEKQKQIAKLKNSNMTRANLVAVINNSITKDNKTLSILQRDEKALEHKIAQLHHQQRKNINPPGIPNKAIFENLSPHMPIISKASKISMHEISAANPNRFIIHAPPGNKVHAINDGKVIFAGWLRGYGLLLIIEHNNDLMSLYGHTQTIFKKAGDKVIKGETIALVGQSGGQVQSGLYFEIRKSTKSIDVRNWFNYETT